MLAAGARAQHAPHGLGLERPRPEPLQLAGRARKHDDDAVSPCRARSRAPFPRGRATARPREASPACALPSGTSPYGRPSRSAIVREMVPICRSSSSSTASGGRRTRATSSTVRSSCVGPRPPETRQRSAANASRNAASRSSARRRPRSRSAPARARGEPPPRRGTARCGPPAPPERAREPVTTIAARGRLKWTARVIRRAVTTNVVPAGQLDPVAVHAHGDVVGCAERELQRAAVERLLCWPRSSVPLYSSLPADEVSRTSIHELPAVAPTTRCTRPARGQRAGRAGALCEAGHGLSLRAAELPRGDDERRRDRDRDERDRGHPSTLAGRGRAAAPERDAPGRARRPRRP